MAPTARGAQRRGAARTLRVLVFVIALLARVQRTFGVHDAPYDRNGYMPYYTHMPSTSNAVLLPSASRC
eukprot:scaffold153562_cov39-Tisochrysis_lutea.AAC.3